MSALTAAIAARLRDDVQLAAILSAYRDEPAVFTVDPPPGDASLPYIVSAGHVADAPFDTKTELGRAIQRDVRCYAEADGSAVVVEAIAERVRELLHRQPLAVTGFGVFLAEVSGPIVANETEAYGRVLTARFIMMEA